jgi:hypothetical protein
MFVINWLKYLVRVYLIPTLAKEHRDMVTYRQIPRSLSLALKELKTIYSKTTFFQGDSVAVSKVIVDTLQKYGEFYDSATNLRDKKEQDIMVEVDIGREEAHFLLRIHRDNTYHLTWWEFAKKHTEKTSDGSKQNKVQIRIDRKG